MPCRKGSISVRESRRYIGLELAGAKNHKTALAVLEHYPKEKKIFLLDLYDRISNREAAPAPELKGSQKSAKSTSKENLRENSRNFHKTGDEALLDLLKELNQGDANLGVNVPLELPPCISCTRKTCPMPAKCNVPSVKWMRQISRHPSHQARSLEFTPYTQRPIELWIRYELLPELPEWSHFEIDETLGGNRAPLTARMDFLRRHLGKLPTIEVLPKLSTSILVHHLGLNKRIASSYRHLELGSHFREEIIEKLAEAHGIFIYERDVRKLATSLTAFDAFICAYTALLTHIGKCEKVPSGFPVGSGWIHYPRLDSC